MYFALLYILFLVGIVIASFCGLMPLDVQQMIPYYFRFLAFIIGSMLAFIGIVMLWIRAKKTGADELIAPAHPGTVKWFYFYRDGEMRILPSKRAGEGQLYNAELDSQVMDVKTYSLCDHKIRIVPEVVGHAVDLDFVVYANLLKTQYGYENLREAREGAFDNILNKVGIQRTKPIVDNEHYLIGDENESLEEKVRKVRRASKPT